VAMWCCDLRFWRRCQACQRRASFQLGGIGFTHGKGAPAHRLVHMFLHWSVGISPKQTPDGHPYIAPFAGFFSRSRPQMADYDFPRRFDLLLTQLGWLSTGCGLYKFASHTFYEAKRLAQPQDLLSLQHLIDLELAELAAREERYQEAFPLAISGIRMVSLSSEPRQRALNMDDSTPEMSLQEVWTSLPLERRQEAERGLYWIIIGPAITRLLVKNAPPEECVSTIRELEIIRRYDHLPLAILGRSSKDSRLCTSQSSII
jgi:hypothetical protein